MIYRFVGNRLGHLCLDLTVRENMSAGGTYLTSNNIANELVLSKLREHNRDATVCRFNPVVTKLFVAMCKSGFVIMEASPDYTDKELVRKHLNCRKLLSVAESAIARETCLLGGIRHPFVCFHARDFSYLGDGLDAGHELRNNDVLSYIPTLKWLVNKGYTCVRMGAKVDKPFPKMPGVVDYATDFRSELLDVYLLAECAFFLSDGCGLSHLATIQGTRQVWVNVYPRDNVPYGAHDVFLFKSADGLVSNTEDEISDFVTSIVVKWEFDSEVHVSGGVKDD